MTGSARTDLESNQPSPDEPGLEGERESVGRRPELLSSCPPEQVALISKLFQDNNRALINFLLAQLPNEQEAREVAQEASLVELGAKTTVAVEFSGKQRLLKLSEGQAYFDVQPDKDRPFTVQPGELEVTALGTAFDVKHQPGSIMVTVQEGIVAVSSRWPAGSMARRAVGQSPCRQQRAAAAEGDRTAVCQLRCDLGRLVLESQRSAGIWS